MGPFKLCLLLWNGLAEVEAIQNDLETYPTELSLGTLQFLLLANLRFEILR